MGRIDLTGAPLDWVGTGWLVAENVIVTNRHVAREFAERKGDGFAFKMGLTELMGGDLDFLQEIGRRSEIRFAGSANFCTLRERRKWPLTTVPPKPQYWRGIWWTFLLAY